MGELARADEAVSELWRQCQERISRETSSACHAREGAVDRIARAVNMCASRVAASSILRRSWTKWRQATQASVVCSRGQRVRFAVILSRRSRFLLSQMFSVMRIAAQRTSRAVHEETRAVAEKAWRRLRRADSVVLAMLDRNACGRLRRAFQ